MQYATYLRNTVDARVLSWWGLCCILLTLAATASAQAVEGQPAADDSVQTATVPQTNAAAAPGKGIPAQGDPATAAGAAADSHAVVPRPGKRQLREAEDAYLAGAKRLERDDLDAAEREFVRALTLDPENVNYAIAISVARQHRVTELVRQATKARQDGHEARSQTLLAQARAIDPENPIVLEHSGPLLLSSAAPSRPVGAAFTQPGLAAQAAGAVAPPLADRNRIIAATGAREPWQIQQTALAGPIPLAPAAGMKAFHLAGSSDDVIRAVASAYGIRAVIDDSLPRKEVKFDLDSVSYKRAMEVVLNVTHAFATPIDETTILVARDDLADRSRLERLLEETIDLPESSPQQVTEIANMLRNVFDLKQATVKSGTGSILVRAPEDVFEPMNRVLAGLSDAVGEVMVEVKMYEIDTTRMTNVGGAIPSQFSVFNVDQAAAQIVSSNQALVQQAIAQGYITAATSNLDIALALIGAGLVQSSLAQNLLGTVGGGVFQTGISASSNIKFNLALNSTDTRALDDVQVRIVDRGKATIREGTRYPIASSTYTTGLSTAASSLSNASINGVSVASLLQQYAGGSKATIPQLTYEDLGITLNATPTIQQQGRVGLVLDLKIEALSGSSANGNPVLVSRQFASNITVGEGESAMMVSSVSRTETSALTGVPGLSELPGFQMPTQAATEKDTSQLVLVVTPHIVRRRSDLMVGPMIAVHPQTPN